MQRVDVYSRRGCHLCEILIEELLQLIQGRMEVAVHDIDTRREWLENYDVRVPVVEYDGRVICEHRLDEARLRDLLRQLAV